MLNCTYKSTSGDRHSRKQNSMNIFPIPDNEKARLKALKNYQILDTTSEKEFNRLAELAMLACDVPVALISFIDEKRQWFKAKIGINLREIPKEISICRIPLSSQAFYEIEDLSLDPDFGDNRIFPENTPILHYAACPLIDPDGFALGTISVLDYKPGKLSGSQKTSLSLLAEEVVFLLTERKKRQESNYFTRILQSSKDLICVVNPAGYLKKLNIAFTEIFGWDEEFLLNTSFFDLIHPDDIEKTKKGISDLQQGTGTFGFTNRIKSKNGEYKTLAWLGTPDFHTGNLYVLGRDVSEETKRSLMLQHSESRFRSFFESSQGLMCTHDFEGKLLSVNLAGAGILGYTPEELIGKRLHDIMDVKHHGIIDHYLVEILHNGKSNGVMHTLHKNGTTRIWLFNNVLEKSPDGEEYVIGNALDITARHYLEADLKKTKEILEQTNQVARVGGWEVNMSKQKLFWSNVSKEIHEVPADYEPDVNTAINFYKEEYRDKVYQSAREAITEGKSWDLEVQILTGTGRERWVRTMGNADFDNGICKRLYGTFQDIDEIKMAELALITEKARLLAFVEHAPAAVAMFDCDIKYVAVSNRWLEEYHLTGRNLLGLSHYDVFPNISDEWKTIHQNCLNGAVEKCEEESWRPEGWSHDQYLRWEVRPWYNLDGSVGGIMMLTQDVTDLSLKKEELRKSKILAEQASIAKSEFLANMSHEIRTPLNGVIGFTDLVLKTNLNETQQQYLSIVNQSANALLNIINDILDFSKIEAGKLELDIDKCDLYEMGYQAADIITFQAQTKGLEVLLNISNDLPRFIWVDSIRIKQILINLLGNAVKFTEKGEIELKIEQLSHDEGDRKTIRFEVRDTGIGIKPEKRSKIFEEFLQEDSSTTKKYGGTGLGLTISNRLLELMGSKLELRSTVGVGSTFYFDLILDTERGEPVIWENFDVIKNVLIVDDNDNNRLIVKQMLLLKNIHSVEAKNGFEALQLLNERDDFDLIMMDYHMPYMDGIETIRKIRENFGDSMEKQPVILLHSSSDDEALIKACEDLKVNQRIVKPIKIHDLFDTLSHLFIKEVTVVKTPDFTDNHQNTKELRILIAEDNPVNKLFAKTLVHRIAPNAIIVEANNGKEALKQCQTELPDLVLMDIQMPEMNGYEATLKIRELNGGTQVPIIALTAGNLKGEREKCLAIGMDDFMAKPFVEGAMVNIFNKWLSSSKDLKPVPVIISPKESEDYFDVEFLKSMVGDDLETIREIMKIAVEELDKSDKSIQESIRSQNLIALKAAGHRLKGTSLSSGLKTITNFAHKFETLLTFDEENLKKLYLDFRKELDLVLPIIKESLD